MTINPFFDFLFLADAKCSGKVYNQWYTESTECEKAYHCSATGQIDQQMTCPTNQQFDRSIGSCVSSAVLGCKRMYIV